MSVIQYLMGNGNLCLDNRYQGLQLVVGIALLLLFYNWFDFSNTWAQIFVPWIVTGATWALLFYGFPFVYNYAMNKREKAKATAQFRQIQGEPL